jgi:hypothetical protein
MYVDINKITMEVPKELITYGKLMKQLDINELCEICGVKVKNMKKHEQSKRHLKNVEKHGKYD